MKIFGKEIRFFFHFLIRDKEEGIQRHQITEIICGDENGDAEK
jgi:hypothetical protein